jgi:hypothetical protein
VAITDPLNRSTGQAFDALNRLYQKQQRALAYMTLPTLAGLNYQAQIGFGVMSDQTMDRVDQNLGNKARLFFPLAYQNTSLLLFQSLNSLTRAVLPPSTRP